jgi:hypothetical protein
MFRVAPWTLALLIACGPPPSPNDPDPPPPSGLDAGVSIDAPGYVGPIRYELRLTGDRFDTRADVSVVISEGGASYGCSKSYGPAAPCPPPPPPAEERFSLRPPAPGEVLTFTTALVEAGTTGADHGARVGRRYLQPGVRLRAGGRRGGHAGRGSDDRQQDAL